MKRASLAAALAALIFAAGSAGAQQRDSFPHAAHAKVFPSCTGCHLGIVTKDAALFPDPSSCAGCHDGQQSYEGRVLRAVNWKAPTVPATNLDFSHLLHAQKTNSEGSTKVCVDCHQRPGTKEFMAVGMPDPTLCLACHEHAAPEHLADAARCSTCHVPLAKAVNLSPDGISNFPRPASHEAPDFLSKHAPADSMAVQRCAVCHTQQSCARCHMNATSIAGIKALGSNPAVAQAIAGKPSQYPEPATHEQAGFKAAHAVQANAINATCGNCHARASCQTCHLTVGAREAIGRLPTGRPGGAQGVQLRRSGDLRLLRTVTFRSPVPVPKNVVYVQVHPTDFEKNHRAEASTSAANCASCHVQVYCTDCHDGVGRIKYHTPDFVQGHASQAYGREQDCASCHNNEAFCVSCHQSLGIGASGTSTATGSFHNQSPNWLLDHGQAARLELQNCASCHKQSDCIKCHSTVTWGINPHGPGFDANRMATKNTQICYYCHVSNPTNH